MKLAEFSDLCWREWGKARGDVVSLALTGASYEELGGGSEIGAVVNPVTRTMVTVTAGADIDTAEVRRHYGTRLEPQAQVPQA